MTTPRSKHLRLLALLLVLVPAASNGVDGARKETARGQEKEQTAAASPEKIRAHIEFLSSDELGGRDSGEAGLEVAAEYIANRFRDYGLEPAGDDGSFFQHFTVPQGARFAEQPAVRVTLAGGRQVTVTWRAATEAEAFGFASSEDNGSAAVDAPLVYAGYGIGVPDGEPEGLTYDDYRGLDVRGKVVLILRFTPRWGEAENPFAAERLTRRHASFAAKLRLAKNHGAAGVIFVTPPGQREDDLYGLARRASPRRPTLPAVVARRAVVERLLERSGNSLSRLVEETDQHLAPRSFLLEGTRVRFATSRRLLRLRNVAGRVAGVDPKLAAETLVVGGHYDHIGRFGAQVSDEHVGKVHNGADDNASGTAGVLELARLFAAGKPPRRSLLFLAFSGEEIGLLGSRHWVETSRRFVTEAAVKAGPGPTPHSSGASDGASDGGGAGASDVHVLWEKGTALQATGEFHGSRLELIDASGNRGWVDSEKLRQVSGPTSLHRVVTMINLDMIGHAAANGRVRVIAARSSPDFPPLLEALGKKVGIPVDVGGRGLGGGSDHAHFVRRGIPVLFFWTGIHRRYNTPDDDVGTLNIEGLARIVDVAHGAARHVAGMDRRPGFDASAVARRSSGHGRPRLGVVVDPSFRGQGARVRQVEPDSVAQRAGLREGDIIVRFGDSPIDGYEGLVQAIGEEAKGEVAVEVRRGDRRVELAAEFPRARGFGVRFGSVPDYAFGEKGVRFEDIAPGTPAARAGVRPGDVLVRWGDEEVEDVEQWTEILRGHQPGDVVKIQVRREKKLVEFEIHLERR